MDSIGAVSFFFLDGVIPGWYRANEDISRPFEDGTGRRRMGKKADQGVLKGVTYVKLYSQYVTLEQDTYPGLVSTLQTITRNGEALTNVHIDHLGLVSYEYLENIIAPGMTGWVTGDNGYQVVSEWRVILAGVP